MTLQAVDKYDAVIELDCSYGLCAAWTHSATASSGS